MYCKLGKYAAVFKIALQSKLAYIYDFLFRQLFLVIVMYVFAQLWRTTYGWEGSSHIAGFTMGQMLWYLALTESMTMAMPRLGAAVGDEVKSGSLAYSLTKPYNYTVFHYWDYLGNAAPQFVFNLLIAGAVTWYFVGPPMVSVNCAALGFISIFFGFSIDFVIQFGLGLLAFWTEDTRAFIFLYSRLLMILGGMMIPLDVFPEAVRRVARILPTSFIIYGPVRIMVLFSFADWTLLVMKQGIWLLALSLAVKRVYGMGVRIVSAHGG